MFSINGPSGPTNRNERMPRPPGDKKSKVQAPRPYAQVSTHRSASQPELSSIFRGCNLYFDGRTGNVSSYYLVKMAKEHGASVSIMHRKSRVTHIVAVNLNGSKTETLLQSGGKILCVHPNWVLDSIKKGKRQPEFKYTIYKDAAAASARAFFGAAPTNSSYFRHLALVERVYQSASPAMDSAAMVADGVEMVHFPNGADWLVFLRCAFLTNTMMLRRISSTALRGFSTATDAATASLQKGLSKNMNKHDDKKKVDELPKKDAEPKKAAAADETKAPTDSPSQWLQNSAEMNLGSFAPKIVVVGVGGAGGNAVNNMIARGLKGVEFLVCNTDAQHLKTTLTDNRIQMGSELTGGLGCGANPEAGRMAAEASLDEIMDRIGAANMMFVTAGMGGGTGTGAAPVIAQAALDSGILTVGVVTKPFKFEGSHRAKLADQGLHELKQSVDTMIVIPNQNLFNMSTEKTSLMDAFRVADDVLLSGVKNITDLMVMPGLINLDFADVQSVMSRMGNAMMGSGEADGDNRALRAAEAALYNPLLGDISIRAAKGMLVNITGGPDMTLFEVDAAAERVTQEVEDPLANIIFGSSFDANMTGKIRVSVVATGIADELKR
ncbi:cell division protein ftsZ [Achlya hypogyna]|uniref:Cell division protein ftsZ n=1 Tax=Achlya hypogyna TaxID=1202772 RepID=A0A1V9YPE5_ACHHY|nr:cell division protein ftsZ [Achlya hypogyna]